MHVRPLGIGDHLHKILLGTGPCWARTVNRDRDVRQWASTSARAVGRTKDIHKCPVTPHGSQLAGSQKKKKVSSCSEAGGPCAPTCFFIGTFFRRTLSALLWSILCDINEKVFYEKFRHWQTVAESPDAEAAALRLRTSRFFLLLLESCRCGYVHGEVLYNDWKYLCLL